MESGWVGKVQREYLAPEAEKNEISIWHIAVYLCTEPERRPRYIPPFKGINTLPKPLGQAS